MLEVPEQHLSQEVKRYQKLPDLNMDAASIAPEAVKRCARAVTEVLDGFPVDELNLRKGIERMW